MPNTTRNFQALADDSTGEFIGFKDSTGDRFVAVRDAVSGTMLVGRRGLPLPFDPGRSISGACVGGSSPWTRLWGPNELRQSPWGGSGEFTTPSTAFKYVTAASGSNGPAMFRREGASIWIDGGIVTANTGNPTYGNLNNFSPGIAAGLLANTTIALLVYVHRLGPTQTVKIRLGASSSDYVVFSWNAANGQLQEGWNVLLASTNSTVEPIGTGAATAGQLSFQSGTSINNGWTRGAGTTFDFTQAIGYAAIETTHITARTSLWIEGVYYGGRDKAQVTIGFDIQTSGLDLAYQTMAKYGLLGYVAAPSGNAAPANPQFLWNSGDAARMQQLYAAGWDIVQHSVSHNSFGGYSDDGMLLAEYEACRAQVKAIGCGGEGADFYTSPNNSVSNRTIALAARAGLRWMRHGVNAPMVMSRGLVGYGNPMLHGAFTMSNQTDAARTLAYVDMLIAYGCTGHLYTHSIITGASNSSDTNVTVFDAICAGIAARIAAGTLEVVTPSRMLREGNPPAPEVLLSNPNRLALTPAASPFDLINTTYKPLRFVISGGTVSSITYSRDGSTFDSTGLTAGSFEVAPGDRLRITYTVAPTIIQYSA